MYKNILLKDMSDILAANANILADCEVVSIGTGTNSMGGWDYIFFIKFENGTEREIRITKQQ